MRKKVILIFLLLVLLILALLWLKQFGVADHSWQPYLRQSKNMTRFSKKLNSFIAQCDDLTLLQNLTINEIINLEHCPKNSKITNTTLDLSKLDFWGNPIVYNSKRNSLISCGAEWIEVKLNEELRPHKTFINKGGLPPDNLEYDNSK